MSNSGIPPAKAGASLKFTEKGGFVFRAVECFQDEIDDHITLGNQILALHKEKPSRWIRDWNVVHTVVRTGNATIAVSRSSGAELNLSAAIDITAADLARVDAGLIVASQSGDLFHAIGAKGISPLFRISQIQRRWLSGLKFAGESISSPDTPSLPSGILEEVTP